MQELSLLYSVQTLCGFLNCSRSGYYKWLKHQQVQTPKDLEDEEVSAIIREIHLRRRIHGYRRITVVLRKQTGRVINSKRVYRLMKRLGVRSVIRRRRYPRSTFGGTIRCDNLLSRDFLVDKPAQKLVTDFTTIFVGQQRCFLSAIIDLYNNEVVACHHSNYMDLSLALKIVRKLLERRPKIQGAILHSDQGGHYTSQLYSNLLKKNGILQSMSRRASPLDNAPIESFFGHFKCEAIYPAGLRSIEEVPAAIDQYIDFYNNERPHSAKAQETSFSAKKDRLLRAHLPEGSSG